LESRGEDTKNKKRKEERSIENFLLASIDRSIDLNLDLLDLFKQKKLKKNPSYEFTKPRSARSPAVELFLGSSASLGIGLGLFFLLLWAGLYF
jgi:hypothetical protein